MRAFPLSSSSPTFWRVNIMSFTPYIYWSGANLRHTETMKLVPIQPNQTSWASHVIPTRIRTAERSFFLSSHITNFHNPFPFSSHILSYSTSRSRSRLSKPAYLLFQHCIRNGKDESLTSVEGVISSHQNKD